MITSEGFNYELQYSSTLCEWALILPHLPLANCQWQSYAIENKEEMMLSAECFQDIFLYGLFSLTYPDYHFHLLTNLVFLCNHFQFILLKISDVG